MADFDITAAMASIPSKLSNLRKSFEALTSSPSFSSCSLSLEWHHIEDHFTDIQNHIQIRLKNLQKSPSTLPAIVHDKLKSFCISSNGSGLWSYFHRRCKKCGPDREELRSLFHLIPVPASLALHFVDGYRRWTPKKVRLLQLKLASGSAVDILEHVYVSGAEIGSEIREKAKGVVREWSEDFGGRRGSDFEAIVFCRFLLVYGLVSELDKEEALDVFLRVLRVKAGDHVWNNRNMIFPGKKFRGVADIWRRLGLAQNVSDIIQILKTHGRHLEVFKLVCALNLSDKYPVVQILDEYLQNCRMTADENLNEGNNSLQLQEKAIEKEIVAARAVIEIVKEYKLDSIYSCVVLIKERIKQLELQNESLKEQAAAVASASSFSDTELLYQQQKRPRLD